MIDYTQKPEYLEFINRVLEVSADFTTIAQVNNGEIEAVAGFNNYSKHNIEISIATNEQCTVTRSFIRACAIYAFGQCGVSRITNIASVNNNKSHRFSERLGFVKEFAPLKKWYGNEDGVQFVMFRESCRWIKDI